jgi:hypothetical protein
MDALINNSSSTTLHAAREEAASALLLNPRHRRISFLQIWVFGLAEADASGGYLSAAAFYRWSMHGIYGEPFTYQRGSL